MHSHSSSGITSRARRALSRAAAQEEKIEVGSARVVAEHPQQVGGVRLFDVVDAHQGEQVAAGVRLGRRGVLD